MSISSSVYIDKLDKFLFGYTFRQIILGHCHFIICE